jgi:integrase
MGSPLWKRGVRGDFIEILTQLGSNSSNLGFTAHTLRHTFATRLAQRNIDVLAIQK